MFGIGIFDKKWATVNTLREIEKKIVEVEIDIPQWAYEKMEYLAPQEYKLIESGIIRPGDRWDENFTYFFMTTFKVPDELSGKNLYLQMDICGESEVYIDNIPKGSIDKEHTDVRLSNCIKEGEVLNIKVQAAKHWHDFIRSDRAWGHPYRHHIFNSSKLICKNRFVEEFYYLAKLVLEISVYEDNREVADQFYEILKNTLYEVDYHEEYSVFVKNIKKASNKLVKEIQRLGLGFKYGKAFFMGHSHLDLAFKWTWDETVRKIERTLSNTSEVLGNYIEGIYIQSQMKIFEVLKQFYSGLYSKIANLIKENRVEPVGDLYVEFDTNIPSGESLVRQILIGKKLCRNYFGRESKVCYLPDTFGYSGILPQILLQAGYKYFVTTKLDWNDTNKPPYLFFNWYGIDGSGIMSHLLASGYGDNSSFRSVKKYYSDPRQKEISKARIYQYGYGDGGGGISEVLMQEKAALKKLNCMVEVHDMTLENSLDEIAKEMPTLPAVKGELYFEKHRGVYTSQAAIKKYNRRSELILRDAEIFSVMAFMKGHEYPQKVLESAWKKVLFNQFHDIIAGSCLGEVAGEAVETYKQAMDEGSIVIRDSLSKMISNGDNIILWNTLGWERNEAVEVTLQHKHFVIKDGENDITYQIISEDDEVLRILIAVENIPPFGYKKLQVEGSNDNTKKVFIGENMRILENGFYRIVFDEAGEMISVFDKSNNREVLKGKGNVLIGYLDRPGYFESWDIAADFEKRAFPIQDVEEMKLIENGPLRWTMKVQKYFRKSTITQYISIYSCNQRIDIRTEMDFYEPQILLKALFDVNITAPYATYDISMGNLQRSTKSNNSYEIAQFEVNMHKWVDLSDENYGVSILNNCKYGCDVKNNKIRITLLKTATFPDSMQDIGHHEFTYSIYPHTGDFREGKVTKEAYKLNVPVIVSKGDIDKVMTSWMKVEGDNIVIETIKKAEDCDDIVVRFYECNGESNTVTLDFYDEVKKAEKCNLLENSFQELAVKNGKVSFHVKPYEIITIKLQFQG